MKMGQNGWIQKRHVQVVRDRLVAKSETETLTTSEIKLLTALNDEIDGTGSVQVAPRKYPISKFIKSI